METRNPHHKTIPGDTSETACGPLGGAGTPCVAWGQVHSLLNVTAPVLLTKHTRSRLCPQTKQVYKLTAAGRAAAELAVSRSTGSWPPPSKTLHPAPTQTGLVLLVDHREGAGETHHLCEIMSYLRAVGVRTAISFSIASADIMEHCPLKIDDFRVKNGRLLLQL